MNLIVEANNKITEMDSNLNYNGKNKRNIITELHLELGNEFDASSYNLVENTIVSGRNFD